MASASSAPEPTDTAADSGKHGEPQSSDSSGSSPADAGAAGARTTPIPAEGVGAMAKAVLDTVQPPLHSLQRLLDELESSQSELLAAAQQQSLETDPASIARVEQTVLRIPIYRQKILTLLKQTKQLDKRVAKLHKSALAMQHKHEAEKVKDSAFPVAHSDAA